MQAKQQTRSLFKKVVAPHPKEALTVWVVLGVILAGFCIAEVAGEPVAKAIVHKLSQ